MILVSGLDLCLKRLYSEFFKRNNDWLKKQCQGRINLMWTQGRKLRIKNAHILRADGVPSRARALPPAATHQLSKATPTGAMLQPPPLLYRGVS